MAGPATDPRHLAWLVLRAVERGAFADAELARALGAADLDQRDRGLATQLVYGTLCWQGLCDYLLGRLERPAKGLEAAVRTLLRLALFQIVKLDRVPDFAVVDTSVELAKLHKNGAAAPLVNALLRRYLRQRDGIALPPASDVAAHLAVSNSHPPWLVEAWIAELGRDDAELLLAANNCAAPTVLRVNRNGIGRSQAIAALQDDGCEAAATAYSPDGIEIHSSAPIETLSLWQRGLVTAQGEASQLIAHLVPAAAVGVLDACAAPGGKSTHLAERGHGVLALDRNRIGLRRLRQLAARSGGDIAHACADASQPPLRSSTRFDAVVVDAPCSGLGTLRQHPEIRWRRQPRHLRELAGVQAALLDAVADHVASGGSLVYATCTIAAQENEHRITDFLAAHPDFAIDDGRRDLPAAARQLVGGDGFLRTFPHRHGMDGFFAARLRRQ